MLQGHSITLVPLEKIDIAHDDFFISSLENLSALQQSIATVGLTQPILLTTIPSSDKFQIISGYRRTLACRNLKKNKIPAIILNPQEINPLESFLINLHDTVAIRSLNLIEKSTVLDKLINKFAVLEQKVISTFLPLLGIQPSKKLLDLYLRLSKSNDRIKQLIVKKEIPLSNAAKLVQFSANDQLSILSFLQHITLGTNKLKELLLFLEEICLRDNKTVKTLLKNQAIREVVSNDSLSGPQKSDVVMKLLRQVRYPHYTDQLKRIESALKKLMLPPGIKITHPPFFEGERWKIELSFRNQEELQQYAKKIEEMTQDRSIEEMMDIAWHLSTDSNMKK